MSEILSREDLIRQLFDENAGLCARVEELRQSLQLLHDDINNVNGGDPATTPAALCVLCQSEAYNGAHGIVHTSDCAILVARQALKDGE